MVGFPLLLIPLAVYNIIVWLMPSVSLGEAVVRLPLMSGAEWPITLGDMLLAFAAVMLLLEIVKGARPSARPAQARSRQRSYSAGGAASRR